MPDEPVRHPTGENTRAAGTRLREEEREREGVTPTERVATANLFAAKPGDEFEHQRSQRRFEPDHLLMERSRVENREAESFQSVADQSAHALRLTAERLAIKGTGLSVGPRPPLPVECHPDLLAGIREGALLEGPECSRTRLDNRDNGDRLLAFDADRGAGISAHVRRLRSRHLDGERRSAAWFAEHKQRIAFDHRIGERASSLGIAEPRARASQPMHRPGIDAIEPSHGDVDAGRKLLDDFLQLRPNVVVEQPRSIQGRKTGNLKIG